MIICIEEEMDGCMGCHMLTLTAQERQRKKMQAEIDKQRKENSELKRKLKELTGELEEGKNLV